MSKSLTFRVHLDDGEHLDVDAASSAAARLAAQKRIEAAESKALIRKIKVLKSEPS